MSDSHRPGHSRRRFFSGALRELAKSLLPADEDEFRPETPPAVPREMPPARFTLRPPGARPEVEFVDICDRSGECVAACPADAIRVIDVGDDSLDGTPEIIPSIQACVICEDLSCMKVCPSGALQLIAAAEIRIGLAEVDHDQCLRSRDEDCRLCVEHCPIGVEAITIDGEGRVDVQPAACTGCGVCEMYCPTAPRAITVKPFDDP